MSRRSIRTLRSRLSIRLPLSILLASAYSIGLLAIGAIASIGYVISTRALISEVSVRQGTASVESVATTIRHLLLADSEATLRAVAEKADSVIRDLGWLEGDGAAPDLDSIETYIAAVEISPTGYIYVLDGEGTVVLHPFPDLVGANVADDEVFRQIDAVQTGFVRYPWANPGEVEERAKVAYSVYVPETDLFLVASDYVQGIPSRLAPGRLEGLASGLLSDTIKSIVIRSERGDEAYTTVGSPSSIAPVAASDQIRGPFLVTATIEDLALEIDAVVDPAVYDELMRRVARSSTIGVVAAFVVIAVLSTLVAKAIAGPIERLNRLTMQRVARGVGGGRLVTSPSLAALILTQLRLVARIDSEHSLRRTAEDQLSISETAFMRSGEGICVTDSEGTIKRVNPAFERVTGYTSDEVIGKNPRVLKSTRHTSDFYSEMWSSITAKGRWTGEIWNKRKSGTEYPELLNITAVYDSANEIDSYVAVFHDLTEVHDMRARLRRATTHDTLTGLPNREYLMVATDQALLRATRTQGHVAILVLSIDGFEDIVDGFGHDAADRLLKWAASRIEQQLRGDDIAAVLGGELFGVLLSNVEDSEQTPGIARRITLAVREPYAIAGTVLRPSVSVGIATHPVSGSEPAALLDNATAALHNARRGGNDGFAIHDPKMNSTAHAKLAIQSRIGRAIEEREIRPVFQPILNLQSNQVIGAEALARWSRNGEIVPPSEFLPYIEQTSAMTRLDTWILEASLEALRSSENLPADFMMSFNAAPVDLANRAFVDRVRIVIEASDCDPENVRMEVTEAESIRDFRLARETIRQIREMGISVYLDDFGEGYSSIRYLREFGIDGVKLDRRYVMDVATSDRARSIVSGFVQLVQGLGLTAIVEGVETEEQLDYLRSIGADCAQGYVVGRPQPIEEINALFEDGASSASRHDAEPTHAT